MRAGPPRDQEMGMRVGKITNRQTSVIYTKDEKVVDRALRSAFFEDLERKRVARVRQMEQPHARAVQTRMRRQSDDRAVLEMLLCQPTQKQLQRHVKTPKRRLLGAIRSGTPRKRRQSPKQRLPHAQRPSRHVRAAQARSVSILQQTLGAARWDSHRTDRVPHHRALTGASCWVARPTAPRGQTPAWAHHANCKEQARLVWSPLFQPCRLS